MPFLLISIIACCIFLALSLVFVRQKDLEPQNKLIKLKKTDHLAREFENLKHKINQHLKFTENIIGKDAFSQVLVPSLVIFVICALALCPWLCGAKYSSYLAIVMSAAYAGRFIFHAATSYRYKILHQLERILNSIRNNLSSGMAIDYAVSQTAQQNPEEPIGTNLKQFIRVAELNFTEKIPSWLKSIERDFKLKELARSAQVLKLQLHYNSNQEAAFQDSAKIVSESIKANKKQSNTLAITFFSLDFFTAAYIGLLVFIIPSLESSPEQSWWNSNERAVVIFISAAIIWSAYALTVFLALRRLN